MSADATPGNRIEYIDVLRGFALTGVCAANLFIFSGVSFMSEAHLASLPNAWADRAATIFELVFIETKFMGLFAMLFGVSFWTLWLFYGFMLGPHLMGRVGGFGLLVTCLVWSAIQASLAAAWLRRYRYGPAEWLWRSLTYWQVQPMARPQNPAHNVAAI